ncbi:MAG: LuxR C-terminal-related transcriptional regulator [Oculatellaceae cyanobacterium bins.114]|nr:LuxR C-terminal-related transcriptional regulator [Oculatellaceae cyanobacterium bins.114]
MAEPILELLDSTRLLFDLQRGNEIAQRLGGCLDPEAIARHVTEGLVAQFDCAFARIWLVEPDRTALRLVASSGMYTHTDGFFGKVPMGAFKVGKIAQNRVSFLSNNLPEESWVKDREWAIANHIRGFAGYPLEIDDRVVGVLALFSQNSMAPEFLEVLRSLCTTVSVALDIALRYQQEKQSWQATPVLSNPNPSLSDQIATVLRAVRLTLVGTEQALPISVSHVFLRAAEVLQQLNCIYCRLTYSADAVAMEAIISAPEESMPTHDWLHSAFGELIFAASCLGGVLQTQQGTHQKVIQVLLKLPYGSCPVGMGIRVQCRSPVLQLAFTHLAYLAGLTVYSTPDTKIPLLTENIELLSTAQLVLWVNTLHQALPKGVHASLNLNLTPAQLREALASVLQGKRWGIEPTMPEVPILSDREQEILSLLAQGLRDRDIANTILISESTVKFHINNVLTKLKARTRYQALYQAIAQGWLA